MSLYDDDHSRCDERDHQDRQCCHWAGHGYCCATWTGDTEPGKVDHRWWPESRRHFVATPTEKE